MKKKIHGVKLQTVWEIFRKPQPKQYPKQIASYELNKVHHHNCLQGMQDFNPETFDMIFADPPFGIKHGSFNTANYNQKPKNVLGGYVEIKIKDYADFSYQWIKRAQQILKSTGMLVIVSGWTNQIDILNAERKLGLTLLGQVIWKYNFGVFTKKRFVSAHYNVFIYVKDPKKYQFNKVLWYPEDVFQSEQWEPQIWEISKEYWTGKTKTPNKLPKELVEMMITIGSNNGDLIIDPFSGSGTTLQVCSQMDRNCIAFDRVKDYVEFGNYRHENLTY